MFFYLNLNSNKTSKIEYECVTSWLEFEPKKARSSNRGLAHYIEKKKNKTKHALLVN
jgi:hypothetical protein